MSLGYCDGCCEHLEKEHRHTCAKYNQKLGYIKRSGGISFTAHEKCDQCQADEWEAKQRRKQEESK